MGGHCLPVDSANLTWYVREQLGRRFRLIELVNEINNDMPGYVVERVRRTLEAEGRSIDASRVLLLGLAYKRNTGDVRKSPAVRVAELLAETGADVHAVDPHVERNVHPHITKRDLNEEEVRAADVVVLLTDHDDFDIDVIASARRVLDCRNKNEGDGSRRGPLTRRL